MRYFGVRSIEKEALFDVRGQWGSCQSHADLLHLLFCPLKMGIRAKGGSEGYAYISLG
jgi:hypothetical protein